MNSESGSVLGLVRKNLGVVVDTEKGGDKRVGALICVRSGIHARCRCPSFLLRSTWSGNDGIIFTPLSDVIEFETLL